MKISRVLSALVCRINGVYSVYALCKNVFDFQNADGGRSNNDIIKRRTARVNSPAMNLTQIHVSIGVSEWWYRWSKLIWLSFFLNTKNTWNNRRKLRNTRANVPHVVPTLPCQRTPSVWICSTTSTSWPSENDQIVKN